MDEKDNLYIVRAKDVELYFNADLNAMYFIGNAHIYTNFEAAQKAAIKLNSGDLWVPPAALPIQVRSIRIIVE